LGFAFKGLPGGGDHSFDVTLQPTVFTSHKIDHASATQAEAEVNDHLETFATLLYRIVDRENVRNIDELSPLAFLNIVGLASIGRTSTGPAFFERTRVGGQVDAKLIGRQRGGMTWLISGRYESQNFSAIGRRYHVVLGSVNMGF
jgi:hypothetical protein